MTTRLIATLTLLSCVIALTGCTDAVAPKAADEAINYDTSPPAPVAGLNAAGGHRAVKLSWEPNTTDADCIGYLVYRVAFGQIWPLTDAPVADPRFLDTDPLLGTALYAITAVDDGGNESAWAQVWFDYQGDDVRPDAQ